MSILTQQLDSFGPLIVMFIVAIIAINMLGHLAKPAAKKAGEVTGYEAQETLISPAEVKALAYLRRAVGNTGHVCPQVRIADFVQVASTKNRSAWHTAFNKISRKHVDFVIINATGVVQFVVEVDDRSHDRPDRKKRDIFVDQVMHQAKIQLIRVQPNKLDQSQELDLALTALQSKPKPNPKTAVIAA